MKRAYTTFVGIDLGGARGKTTAVAVLSATPGQDADEALVENVTPRRRQASGGDEPWTDDAVLALLDELLETKGDASVCVAIDAPLTVPACIRCSRQACPGQALCEDAATVWLETRGAQLVRAEAQEDLIALPSASPVGYSSEGATAPSGLYPYVHRCTEIELHYERGSYPRERIGQSGGPVSNRAQHLVRRLESKGFELNDNLIEVAPRATVTALFGAELGRGYKRDADPWRTRATILEGIGDEMRFAAKSRLSREQCLANDNCFEALLSAYTAYLYARDGWTMPEGPFGDDGWIWSP